MSEEDWGVIGGTVSEAREYVTPSHHAFNWALEAISRDPELLDETGVILVPEDAVIYVEPEYAEPYVQVLEIFDNSYDENGLLRTKTLWDKRIYKPVDDFFIEDDEEDMAYVRTRTSSTPPDTSTT